MEVRTKQGHHYIICCLLLAALFITQATVSVPQALAAQERTLLTNCTQIHDASSNSLLVVLLDRSGSLTSQPGATDPDGYSTSVTKALTDLWPGSMAVIPFSNDSTPIWGPYTLSDQSQRAALKNAIQNYPIGGDTPLAPAMQKALNLFKHAPTGSRMIIVTDGSPDPQIFAGVNQIDEIEQTLIPQFCAQAVPVSTFGLTLDLTQADGQIANKLLSDIATRTGGEYINIQNVAQLASVIIPLFSQWLHLTLIPAQLNKGSYDIPIDTYAQKVIFVAFRSQSTFNITLKGPDAQPLPAQAAQLFTDRHYEIADLLVSSANQPGIYSVDVSGDPGAQVFALVETGLHATLLQPTGQTIAYIGQPLTIQAELLDNATPIIPRPEEATLNVDVSILTNGQTAYHTIVELVQGNNNSLFSRQITLSGPVGQVDLQVIASYLQIPVEASTAQISIPLQHLTPVAHQGSVCGINAACSWLFSPFTALGGISGLLLLLLFLLFLLSKKPDGWLLTQSGYTKDLGEIHRPLFRRIFYRSVLNSSELENYFDFCDAHFDLLFKQELSIRLINDEVNVKIKQKMRTIDLRSEDGVIEISDKDVIIVDKCIPAIFSQKRDV